MNFFRPKLCSVLLSFLTIAVVAGCGESGTTLNVDPVMPDGSVNTSLRSGSGVLSADTGETVVSELAKKNVFNVTIDLNVQIIIPKSANPHATSDTVLWGTLVKPNGGEKLPTILLACPYRREIMMMFNVAAVSAGYNFLAIDIRGTGSSGGLWESFGLVEQYDVKYIVDNFIPSQSWSDGKVGMVGGSYLGIIQLLTAGLVDTDPATGEPLHLKAIMPQVPMADVYKDIVMHGGNLDLLFIPMWLGIVDILGLLPSLIIFGDDGSVMTDNLSSAAETIIAHAKQMATTTGWVMDVDHMTDGDFYKTRSAMIYWPVKPSGGWGFSEGNKVISPKLAVLEIGGWFDIFTRGTFNTYQYGLSATDQSDKRLIVGEFYHLEGATGIGLNSVLSSKLTARWFDWKIKGIDDPVMDEYPVMLFVMGENRWRGEKTWPLDAGRTEKKTLYLTKKNPSAVEGDWYTDEPWWLVPKKYTDNNYGLSTSPDYSGTNPVLEHNPLELAGLKSRASTRWLMGMEALIADISKYFLGKNIDEYQFYEDERSDEKTCLTFTTEELSEDVEVTGPLTVTFWAKTKFGNALTTLAVNMAIDTIKAALNIDSNLMLDSMKKKDVQWIAELNDVFEDGRARNITSGWLSAWHRPYDPSGKTTVYYEGPWYNRQKVVDNALDPAYVPFDPFYRNPDINPKAITEGQVYQYTIELWPTCNVFKKGHRIRISLSASDFPHLLPILQPSSNTIVIDEKHQAKVEFTSANKANEGTTWAWIGDNDDADAYLLDGGATGCGTSASAAKYRGTASGFASELLGLIFIMMIPLSLIYAGRFARRIRNRKAA